MIKIDSRLVASRGMSFLLGDCLNSQIYFLRNLSVRLNATRTAKPFVSRCKFNLTLNWSHYFATLYPPTRQRMEFDLRYGRTTSPLFQSSSFFLSICSLFLSLYLAALCPPVFLLFFLCVAASKLINPRNSPRHYCTPNDEQFFPFLSSIKSKEFFKELIIIRRTRGRVVFRSER